MRCPSFDPRAAKWILGDGVQLVIVVRAKASGIAHRVRLRTILPTPKSCLRPRRHECGAVTPVRAPSGLAGAHRLGPMLHY